MKKPVEIIKSGNVNTCNVDHESTKQLAIKIISAELNKLKSKIQDLETALNIIKNG